MENLLYILYLPAGLLVGILGLPVVVSAGVSRCRESTTEVAVDFGLLMGLVGANIRLIDGKTLVTPAILRYSVPWPSLRRGRGESTPDPRTAQPSGELEEAIEKSEIASEQMGSDSPQFFGALRQKVEKTLKASPLIIRPAFRLLVNLKRTVRFRRLAVSGEIGLANPATTGQLCALLGPISRLLPQSVRIDVQPDFTRPVTSGQGRLVLQVHVGYILFLCLWFGLSVALRWACWYVTLLATRMRDATRGDN